ncbi:class I SAM-dependent DNA methyltransferase [Planctobacterium marinum]|uniref:Methyltransferase n=1 Tax=Planctobacterium marinum TaxID=1631968 RepID=A0AA48HPZ0_9ALTE|nr:methyltransferase [Planctobacterium marinum]
MSDSWDDYADGWDSNDAVIHYAIKAHEALLATMSPAGMTVLDFGCGTGLLTEKLASVASSVVALDTSSKMLSVLKQKALKNVTTFHGELTQTTLKTEPLLQQKFDLIVASSALAFVPDYVATVKLLALQLAANGTLVQWDWLKAESAEGMGFSEEQIDVAMQSAGLKDIQISVPFSLNSPQRDMPVVMAVAKKNNNRLLKKHYCGPMPRRIAAIANEPQLRTAP